MYSAEEWIKGFRESMSQDKGGDNMSMRDEMDKLVTRLLRYSSDSDRWADHEEMSEISDWFRGRSSAFRQASVFIKAVLKVYKKPAEKEPE